MVKKRKAIAMIELIVAIVIMGIAFLAIPMINNEAIKSGENAMLQESIAAGASQIELILTRSWDSTMTDGDGIILQTASSAFNTYGSVYSSEAGSRVTDNGGGTLNASAIGQKAATISMIWMILMILI